MADILVAEDYPATRSVLRTLLMGAGHTVRFAVNGEEALVQVAQKRPDLLLLDVMMPKKSGYEVLGEIRRTDAAPPPRARSARRRRRASSRSRPIQGRAPARHRTSRPSP